LGKGVEDLLEQSKNHWEREEEADVSLKSISRWATNEKSAAEGRIALRRQRFTPSRGSMRRLLQRE